MINLMRKRNLLLIISLFIISCLPGISATINLYPEFQPDDSIDKQIIFNGRSWRNLYGRVQGHQFLLTSEFNPGNVTIDGKLFRGLNLKYDIYNDELLTITGQKLILQLNKEMVDKFSINFRGTLWNFLRLEPDSVNRLSGYVRVLYDGNTSLFLKYKKDILLLAVDNKYDQFDQTQKIYLRKGGMIFPVKSRKELLNMLKDHKQQLKAFIKSRKIDVSKQNPESFAPVVEYYDKLLN